MTESTSAPDPSAAIAATPEESGSTGNQNAAPGTAVVHIPTTDSHLGAALGGLSTFKSAVVSSVAVAAYYDARDALADAQRECRRLGEELRQAREDYHEQRKEVAVLTEKNRTRGHFERLLQIGTVVGSLLAGSGFGWAIGSNGGVIPGVILTVAGLVILVPSLMHAGREL